MTNEMLKKRIIEQIQESWDEKKINDHVESRKMMGGTENLVAATEEAVKYDLLRMNASLFTEDEFAQAYAIILEQKASKIDAAKGKGSRQQ